MTNKTDELKALLEALAPNVMAIKQYTDCIKFKLADGRIIDFDAKYGAHEYAQIDITITEWDVTLGDIEDPIPF